MEKTTHAETGNSEKEQGPLWFCSSSQGEGWSPQETRLDHEMSCKPSQGETDINKQENNRL